MKKKPNNNETTEDPGGDPSHQDEDLEECSICQGPFDLDKEGGITGDIGIIPMAFCPTCLCGVVEMVFMMYPDAEEFQEEDHEEANTKAAELIRKERSKR